MTTLARRVSGSSLPVWLVFVFVFAVAWIAVGGEFVTVPNLQNIAQRSVALGLVAVGLVPVGATEGFEPPLEQPATAATTSTRTGTSRRTASRRLPRPGPGAGSRPDRAGRLAARVRDLFVDMTASDAEPARRLETHDGTPRTRRLWEVCTDAGQH